MSEILVCGGSIIGLTTAMLLADQGHAVTVLESDPAPVPDRPAAAWEAWGRRGVAQFRQPHNLLARARQVLDADLPEMTDRLLDAGCVWVDPLASRPPALVAMPSEPGDERFRYVTGRRPVMEATFAHAAERHPGVTVRRGVVVRGLLADTSGAVPRVRGVSLEGGDALHADLVIDAMGRRSKVADWLRELGAADPPGESEESGFVYYTRYFAGPERPVTIGPPVAEHGSVSVLTIPGDNGTWSLTVWAATADTALRGLRDPGRFAKVVAACPLQAHWLRGEPITDVLVMAGILDRYRRFVADGRPVATGVVAVGDAWGCTNPSAGRGLSVGLLHAQRLRDAVSEGIGDGDAFVRRFDALTERDVEPFVRNQLAADRARIAEMEALRAGRPVAPADPTARALGAAMLHDPAAFRAMLEMAMCLALPTDVFARPGFADRLARFSGEGESPGRLPGPDRAQLLELVA